MERRFRMSDVEKDIEVAPEDSDFEGHRQKRANDESGSDSNSESDSDFEGHKKKV